MKRTIQIILTILVMQSCTSYDTDLNTMEKLDLVNLDNVKEGEACSYNLFGGFKLPYIGDTAIRISGDESVVTAIKKANITRVYAIDLSSLHYVFYSRRCTMVFGE